MARNHFTNGSQRFGSRSASGLSRSSATAWCSTVDGYLVVSSATYALMRVGKRVSSSAKSNHQRGYRRRNRMRSSMAAKRPPVMPVEVVVAQAPPEDCTLWVPSPVRMLLTITIGTTRTRRKAVVARLSRSG